MKITNLNVQKGEKLILNDLNTEFEEGKIHLIMGPNGSGKSTLSYSIVGHPDCNVLSGEILYKNKNLLEKSIEERSIDGVYLSPQYPPVIEGLSHASFLKEVINVHAEAHNKDPIDDFKFLKQLKEKATEYSFDPKIYPKQSLNSGFSGGEKKRNEILQISLLNPEFIILDEIDSGLDIEAMKKIATFINEYKKEHKTVVVITHYPQFAELIDIDKVHIIKSGKVVYTGKKDTISKVMNNGFGDF